MCAPGRPAQRQVVGRAADRSAHVGLNPGLAQYRHQFECGGPVLLDCIHVFWQQVCTEPLGYTVPGKMFQAVGLFIRAKHQSVPFFPHIAVDRFITQDQQLG